MADANGNVQLPPIYDFEEVLAKVAPTSNAIALAPATLDSVAVHDFAYYEYLLPTEHGYRRQYGELSPQGWAYVAQLEARGAPPDQLERLANFLLDLEAIIRTAIYLEVGAPPESDWWMQTLL